MTESLNLNLITFKLTAFSHPATFTRVSLTESRFKVTYMGTSTMAQESTRFALASKIMPDWTYYTQKYVLIHKYCLKHGFAMYLNYGYCTRIHAHLMGPSTDLVWITSAGYVTQSIVYCICVVKIVC